MKKTILTLTLLIAVLSGYNSFAQTAGDKAPAKTPPPVKEEIAKGWSPEDRHTFIEDCFTSIELSVGTDTARFYCYCMQEKMEKKFPTIAEANKQAAVIREKPEWKKNATDCFTGVGKWTSQDRSEFLSECVNAAQDAVGKEKAKTYCECMLFKIEKKYPDPNDADLSEETLATPEWKKLIKDCMEF